MKYIKKLENFGYKENGHQRYFWKVELDYLEISLSKIKLLTPVLITPDDDDWGEDVLTWGDDDNKILITYDDGDWSWSGTWNYDKLNNEDYEYLGEIILEPHEKKAIKYNL